MAPYQFPEEIDVFTAPHSRMKELVDIFRVELSSTDYHNENEVQLFLQHLHSTFLEFKSHEDIENRYIMENLRSRMHSSDKLNSVVCKCHDNNHLSEILDYVKNGSVQNVGDKSERINYLTKLKSILDAFIDTFLPHMKEEEEIFQPLLMKYFEYEELRELKSKIMKLHEEYKELLWFKLNAASDSFLRIEDSECDYFHPDSFRSVSSGDIKESSSCNILDLPLEVQVKIFSYLTPIERFKCSEVCSSWRSLLYIPKFWNVVSPLNWIKNLPVEAENDPTDLFNRYQSELLSGCDEELLSETTRESQLLDSLVTCHLPVSGLYVKKCMFTGSIALTSEVLHRILSLCLNIEHLDVAYTKIDDSAFDGLSVKRALTKLRHLDMSGCEGITDSSLERLVQCFMAEYIKKSHSSTHGEGLEYISLSGCFEITSACIEIVSDCPRITEELRYLDISGCYRVKGCSLSQLVSKCPRLAPGNLYYCDYIMDGPYQQEANGCQNLHDPLRACCSKCP